MVEEASREPFLVVYATRSSVCRRKKKPIAGEKKTSADAVDDVTQAQLASASPQRILDLSRYGVRPYDIGGSQFLTQPTAAVSKIHGNPP